MPAFDVVYSFLMIPPYDFGEKIRSGVDRSGERGSPRWGVASGSEGARPGLVPRAFGPPRWPSRRPCWHALAHCIAQAIDAPRIVRDAATLCALQCTLGAPAVHPARRPPCALRCTLGARPAPCAPCNRSRPCGPLFFRRPRCTLRGPCGAPCAAPGALPCLPCAARARSFPRRPAVHPPCTLRPSLRCALPCTLRAPCGALRRPAPSLRCGPSPAPGATIGAPAVHPRGALRPASCWHAFCMCRAGTLSACAPGALPAVHPAAP